MKPQRLTLPALLGFCLLTVAVSLRFGAVQVPLLCAWPSLWSSAESQPSPGCPDAELVRAVFSLRLPRVVLAVCVGSGLGLSGAALQALFRNPLVDPGLIGVSSGAALFAAVLMVLGRPSAV